MIDLHYIVLNYGLDGLFIASAIGSTIFVPFTVELWFPLFLRAGIPRLSVLAYATAGALLGTLVNYALGFYGAKVIQRHAKGEGVVRAKRIMDRYGWLGVFVILVLPIPLPVDALTIVCGLTRMSLIEFTITVLAAKIIKYSLALELFSLFIH